MEIENLNLKSRIMQLEAQANKYFHLKLQKEVMDKKISRLQVEMVQKQKSIRKFKSKAARYRKDISDKSSSLKKMEHHLKKIWSLLLVLGNKLRINGMLTVDEKDHLRIEYKEWFTLLVSQDKRKTEEVFNMLNDLPISLFEVLNDSDYSTQNIDSNLKRELLNKEQDVLSNSNEKLISESWNNYSSSLESNVTSPKLYTDELSIDHNIIASPSISVSDSETDNDSFDNQFWELKADISNNHSINEPVKPILNKPLKQACDQNYLDISCKLEDQLDTELCEMNESELKTCKVQVSEKPDEQEASVNVAIPSNILQNDSTSSQMPLTKNCILDSANISTLCSNSHSNLNSLNFISKKNSVGSKNVIDNSKCDSTNSPSKILYDTISVQCNNEISKKRITQQSKKTNRKKNYDDSFDKSILLSKTPSSLKKDESLDLDFNNQSKENTTFQNEKILKDPAKVKRTTIMLPGPPIKISRKRKQCLAEEEGPDLQNISYPHPQTLSSASFVKKVQESSFNSLQPKKKSKVISNKGASYIAPIRVRGRALINRRTLRKKNIEFESIDVTNECNEECNKVNQTLRSESEVTEDKSMPKGNFVSTCKPPKIRKEHKRNLSKDFKNKGNNDKEELACEKNENSITNETETNFHNKDYQKLENDVSDLLKRAESSKAKKNQRLQGLPLFQYFNLKAKDRNLTNSNIFKNGIFKKGITRCQKSQSFISNINISHCTDKIQELEAKEESACNMVNDFDQAKIQAAYTNERLGKELPFIISEDEIQTDIALKNIQKQSSVITSENIDSDTENSESFTVMKENTFLESEITSSIENVNMSPIERKSIKCTIKSDSDNESILSTAKDLDSKEDISENNSDFEGTLVIDEKLNTAENIISNKNYSSSPEEMEVDDFNEKYISTCDSDSESPLVIDENFDVEQCITSEEKHNKPQDENIISKNEYDDYLNLIDGNLSEHIKEKHNPLVYTQNASNFSNNCGTSTVNRSSKTKIISASNVKNKSILSLKSSLTTSLTSIKVDVGIKCKTQFEKCLNEQENELSASENEDSKCCDKEIIEKGYQEKDSSTLSSSKSNKNTKNKMNIQVKLNKKKRKKSPKNNLCAVAKSLPEKFFEEFQNIEFSEENFKQNSKKLFNFLINPTHFPNNSRLLFHVLNYLQASKTNPLLTHSVSEDSSVLFPLDENCIVATLFMIESKKKLHLDGLLKTSVTTIHHLIISSKKFGIYGLASLCRVFTAICKEEGDSLKPIILCGELLKMKHQFAPYLIASVAGVWKELFQVDSNLPAEEFLFHSCILYGASKRPKQLVDGNWRSSIGLISKYFTALPVHNTRSAIHMLKELINARCEDDTWNNQYVSSAMIILAGFENWEWTEENLLTEFIIPNLNNYGYETLNENAFDLFCNLYVEAFLLSPGNPLDTVLIKYFNSSTKQDDSFVRDSAALALMKFVYRKNRKLPSFLSSWFELNKDNPKVKLIEHYYETPIVDSLSLSQNKEILH